MNVALALGIIVLAGFIGGKLAHRVGLPMITGYIVVGALMGPSLLNVVPDDIVADLDPFTSVALGIIAYSIGNRLHVRTIRRLERSILFVAPLQAVGALLLSLVAVTLVAPFFVDIPGATLSNTYLPLGLIVGALASATAPAAILAIVREYRARGPLTTTLLSVVAFDDAIAIVLFSLAMAVAQPLAQATNDFSATQMLLLPILKVLAALGIGTAFGIALLYLARFSRTHTMALVVTLGTILLCVGVTMWLDVSEILANMTIGFIVANEIKVGDRQRLVNVIDHIEDVVFVIFFVLAGLHFDVTVMSTAGVLAALVIAGRSLGKYAGTRIGAEVANSPDPVKKYLGLALLPKAGVTLGLALLVERAFPTFGAIAYNGILASVIINELIAPPLVKLAITRSGERRVG
jgi:NhaP-type Na+/H+ or K+/H+ antiporter